MACTCNYKEFLEVEWSVPTITTRGSVPSRSHQHRLSSGGFPQSGPADSIAGARRLGGRPWPFKRKRRR